MAGIAVVRAIQVIAHDAWHWFHCGRSPGSPLRADHRRSFVV